MNTSDRPSPFGAAPSLEALAAEIAQAATALFRADPVSPPGPVPPAPSMPAASAPPMPAANAPSMPAANAPSMPAASAPPMPAASAPPMSAAPAPSMPAFEPPSLAGGLPFSLPLGLVDEAPRPGTSAPYFTQIAAGPAPAVSLAPAPQPPARPFETHLFDAEAVRRDFPILRERVHGRPLIWLDNAATTQKPQAVIDRLTYFYEHENSNIHRAAHTLAARATDAYEGARETVRRFLNAPSAKNVVFARGATEAINLVAQSWGRRHVGAGDEIVVSWLEHHANIVPWQLLAAEKGARLRVAPVDSDGQILLDEFERLLGPRTRLVAVSQVSNALGTITPAREMVAAAHRHGARVLVDGAQSVSHIPVDVQALDCDFFCFSGHKIFGPTGIGALYGKSDALAEMPPWQGGGNMIADVTFEKTVYQEAPARFEAGTGNIADAVGLAAALDYVSRLGLPNIARHEHELLEYATGCLTSIPGFRMIGTAREKAGVISFVLGDLPPEEIGAALDREGIAVRAGHHCAQPILRRFGLEKTVRASLAPYNTRQDVDALAAALRRLAAGGVRAG